MSNSNHDMFDFLSSFVTKSDVYAAKAIAQVSMYIFKCRTDLKMTQNEFAKMMGVTQSMISKWESAEYNFTIETIAQIAEKLHFSFEIEFAPESEYQANKSQNEFDRPIEGYARNIPEILEYSEIAA